MNKLHQIDPHSHTNYRTEFRLNNNNTIIYANLRLADVGSTNAEADSKYIYNGGVMNLVNSITLYAGNQQLDKINYFHKWNGFKNLVGSQDDSEGIKKPNTASQINISTELVEISSGLGEIKANDFSGKFNVPLPILEVTGYLFFDDLRVVIEWNTSPLTVYAEANRPANFTVNPPSLIYNEWITPDFADLKKESLNETIAWSSIENDVVGLSQIVIGGANPSPNPQYIDTRVRGFDGKTVNRMVIVNDSSKSNPFVGNTHSVAQNLEKLNFRVNGRLLMPYNGIDNENQKIKSLNSWGGCTIYQGGQYTQQTEGYLSQVLQSMSGQFSYASVDVKQKVNDLNIQYQRTGKTGVPVGDTSFLAPLNIYMFAEVLKFASVDAKGNISVTYDLPKTNVLKTVKVKKPK